MIDSTTMPLVIYLIMMADTIRFVLFVTGIITIVTPIVLLNEPRNRYFENDKIIKRGYYICAFLIFAGIAITLFSCFLPSKQTAFAIYISTFITPENVSAAEEMVKTIIESASSIY